MPARSHAGSLPEWRGPERCPFCGAELANGGSAFVDHLATSPSCDAGFEAWRERVADDIGGEWIG